MFTRQVGLDLRYIKKINKKDFRLDSNALTSGYIKEMQNDPSKLRKIVVRCQPRSKFRPRTQNESKNSSHYVRCEDHAEFDYPTINVRR